ncbi:hypothetical protein MERGE_002154 [Pneumocystis wakefieldiae]|uniref:Intimal thickness related receptor IRP domain-containing protein n=1 Tax=Pneumocystis wakefieldiae TaxID=38082 RepID=A0A899FLH5_9ASCO|nr:hypothetical protein MERGE_002154 [Pneumocystis wakefieldiae]
MKRAFLLIICAVFRVVFAERGFDFTLGNLLESHEQCSGMYGRNKGYKRPSTIEVLFSKNQVDYEDLYVVVFEWGDIRYLGKRSPDNKTAFICNEYAVSKGLCQSKDNNTLLTNVELDQIPSLFSRKINVKNTTKVEYTVRYIGYYCVGLIPVPFSKYFVTINWNNYYGKLPASEYPKLVFYAFISAVYLLIGFFWGALCIRHRKNILSVQKYITVIIVFLVIEMIISYGYYKYININGYDSGSFIYLSVVALINAARSSFSLFILLIVSMGYSIVKIIFISRENLKLFAPLYWRIRWLVLYGFLDILYLIVFVTIIVLWRPTTSNIRLAISDEVVQDDDFEVDDLDFAGTGNSSPNSINKVSQEFLNDVKKQLNKEKRNHVSSKHMFSIDDGQFHEIDEKN